MSSRNSNWVARALMVIVAVGAAWYDKNIPAGWHRACFKDRRNRGSGLERLPLLARILHYQPLSAEPVTGCDRHYTNHAITAGFHAGTLEEAGFMNRPMMTAERPLTLAEICQAIEAGQLAVEMENGEYVVRQRDLVRLARQQPATAQTVRAARPRPALALAS